MTTIEVSIDTELEQSLEQIASEQGTTIEKVLNDLAREYVQQARRAKITEENDWLEDRLWESWNRKIDEESERYQSMHQQLLEQYEDKVIALREGEVVDIGEDLGEVYHRVRARYGEEPIFITKVGPEPIESYTIHSPRLTPPGTK